MKYEWAWQSSMDYDRWAMTKGDSLTQPNNDHSSIRVIKHTSANMKIRGHKS